MSVKDKVIVALDVDSLEKAKPLVEVLAPHVGYFKIGLELLMAAGAPAAVEMIHGLGGRIFLDGKFHDIPNTVGRASKAVAKLGVEMFNVHASSGIEALRQAQSNKGKSKLLVVTILTSMNDAAAQTVYGANCVTKIFQFAKDAKSVKADGIVCSPQDLPFLSQAKELKDLIKVTPGCARVAAAGDQYRIMTPKEAIEAGATALVIGRPITDPPSEIGSPVEAVKRIIAEIEEAKTA